MILLCIFLMELFIDISPIELPIPLNFPAIDWKSTVKRQLKENIPKKISGFASEYLIGMYKII